MSMKQTGRIFSVGVGLVVLCMMTAAPSWAQQAPNEQLPGALREVGFEQRLGQPVNLGLDFVDDTGQAVKLGDYFGEKPVMLALVYYECPMICNMVLSGLTSSLKVLQMEPGNQFELVVVSFNPDEEPPLAAAKKANYVDLYGRPETKDGWHFLTGNQDAIAELCDSVGFRYTYDDKIGEYAHATGLTIITPSGQVSRYLFGIEYPPRDMRLALVESGEEKIGGVVEQLLLFCYSYDPATGKYGAAVMRLVRGGAILTTLGILGFIVIMRRRDRRISMTSMGHGTA